jgi:hypothetical protein
MTITPNQALDVVGNNTMDLVTLTSVWGGISQPIATSVTASTNYTFSFDVKRGSQGSTYEYTITDESHGGAAIIDDVYYSSTSTTVTRLSFNFTTPSGCTSISVIPYTSSTIGDNAYIGRCQVALVGKTYVATTTTPVL